MIPIANLLKPQGHFSEKVEERSISLRDVNYRKPFSDIEKRMTIIEFSLNGLFLIHLISYQMSRSAGLKICPMGRGFLPHFPVGQPN
jgi:hypothetical protein